MANATLKDIKEFFEFPNATAFKNEWSALSEEEQNYFKENVPSSK
jgi:hypothetical protein